jgi:acetyltransferase-like isoleucine patch superfamily enzyme
MGLGSEDNGKRITEVKTAIKHILHSTMRALSLPVYLLYRLESVFVGDRKAFGMVSQWVSIIPGLTGEFFRRAFLQWATGLSLRGCCISFGTTFSDPGIRIADGVYLGRGCDIGYADIGPNCVIGSGVHIISGLRQHGFEDLDVPIKEQQGGYTKVTVGEDTWIGNGAIIGADVGRKCVIGVGSVVVKPIPDLAIAAGNPARVIRSRTGKEENTTNPKARDPDSPAPPDSSANNQY